MVTFVAPPAMEIVVAFVELSTIHVNDGIIVAGEAVEATENFAVAPLLRVKVFPDDPCNLFVLLETFSTAAGPVTVKFPEAVTVIEVELTTKEPLTVIFPPMVREVVAVRVEPELTVSCANEISASSVISFAITTVSIEPGVPDGDQT